MTISIRRGITMTISIRRGITMTISRFYLTMSMMIMVYNKCQEEEEREEPGSAPEAEPCGGAKPSDRVVDGTDTPPLAKAEAARRKFGIAN